MTGSATGWPGGAQRNPAVRIRFAVAAALALCVGGCFPMPHTDYLFPAIRGQVLRSGVPVAGAEIFATARPLDEVCGGAKRVGTTDEEGRFSVEPEKDFQFFMVIGDPLSSWTLCIEHAGMRYVGWADRSVGFAPESIRMECDLDDPVAEQNDGEGLCSWEEE